MVKVKSGLLTLLLSPTQKTQPAVMIGFGSPVKNTSIVRVAPTSPAATRLHHVDRIALKVAVHVQAGELRSGDRRKEREGGRDTRQSVARIACETSQVERTDFPNRGVADPLKDIGFYHDRRQKYRGFCADDPARAALPAGRDPSCLTARGSGE